MQNYRLTEVSDSSGQPSRLRITKVSDQIIKSYSDSNEHIPPTGSPR